jgi:DNA-binding response OmpR family regulator
VSHPPHDPEATMQRTPAVLVIDDDPKTLSLCTRHLAQAGYLVLNASSSAEGLQTCHTYQGKIDLVVLDLCLPLLPQPGRRLSSVRLHGDKLLEQIRLTRSGSRFLVTSAVAPWSLHGRGLGWLVRQVPFLPKPFEASTFLTKVQDVLRAPLPTASRAHMPWRHLA